MRMKSVLANGLLFAGIMGGAMAVMPMIAAIVSNAPLEDMALIGGIFLVWASLGFAAGICSHDETETNRLGCQVPIKRIPGFRHWLYRIVAGLLLSYISAAVVGLLWVIPIFVSESGMDQVLLARFSREQVRLMVFMGMCGMMGATTGAPAACLIGAVVMPGDDRLANLANGSSISALAGLFAGGWLGGLISSLHPKLLDENQAIIFALIAGCPAGIAAAIFIRKRFFSGGPAYPINK